MIFQVQGRALDSGETCGPLPISGFSFLLHLELSLALTSSRHWELLPLEQLVEPRARDWTVSDRTILPPLPSSNHLVSFESLC